MIYIQFDKAIRTMKRVLPLCLCVLIPFMTSCREDDSLNIVETAPLTFYLQAAAPQTRTYIGNIQGTDEEKAINSVKVWLFDNTTGVLQKYYSGTIGTDGKVTMDVPQSFVSSGHKADFYIIANGASAGISEGEEVTSRSDLENVTFGTTNNFTAANPTTSVPTAGLPMSRIVKGMTISSGGQILDELPVIELTRAVSKIRFAFARTTASTGDIIGIQLNSNLIADQEYIFPVVPDDAHTADYSGSYRGDLQANIVSGSYENNPMLLGKTPSTFTDTDDPLVLNENIQVVEQVEGDVTTLDPTHYVYNTWASTDPQSSMSDQARAVAYNNLMTPLVSHDVYLRESGKQLVGSIYYRQSPTSAIKTAYFNMTETSIQDFARNHIWVVYGYFLGDKFNLIIQTIPWEDSYITVNYDETPSWKDEGKPEWTPALTTSNSGTETIGTGSSAVTYKVVYVDGGDTPSCRFLLDGPQGWDWMAVLEPLTDGAGDYISFLDGSSVATGSVGMASTLSFKVATTSTSVTHKVRLRLYVRTTSGDMSYEVSAYEDFRYIISRNI